MKKPKDWDNKGEYSEFIEEHRAELLMSAAAAIDPEKMNMDRDQALTLGGAMKACGFDRQDYADIMAKSPQDKGTFSSPKQWEKFTGKGQHGTAGEGTIFAYAQQCGWKWPAPSEFEEAHSSKKTDPPQKPQAPQLANMAKWNDDFRISVIIDEVGYSEKPSQVWEIRNREKVSTPAPQPITIEEFAEAVTSGRTFSPTVYSKELIGYTEDNKPKYYYRPISQQVFVVDFDNEERVKDSNGNWVTQRIEKPLTIDDAMQICEKNGIAPFFIYETFSSKEHRDDPEAPYSKFRFCFATSEPVTIQEYGERGLREFISFFIGLFGEAADGKTTDPARLIYGTDEKERAKARNQIIDKEKLYSAIQARKEVSEEPEPEEAPEAAAEAAKEEYLKTSAAARMQEFLNGIKDSVNTPVISTGFKNLDSILDGGLYKGLYVLGAISSLGKTTLALQLADNIARQGQDVIIFSLEMEYSELMAKSISRLTYLLADSKADAKTARGITTGARYASYSETEKALINKAIGSYEEYYKNNIYLQEGVGDIGVEKVREVVEQHISSTGNKPVVFIDYMQILAPYDMRSSDKQNTDKNVLELKRLSRDYKIPVIGVSSFNRDSYKAGSGNKGRVGQTDFKESGAIEYSADVLIGLEFMSAGSNDYSEKEEKRKDPRQIRLVILKNRNGRAWESCGFNYFPLFNYYEEYMEDFTTATAADLDIFKGLRGQRAK